MTAQTVSDAPRVASGTILRSTLTGATVAVIFFVLCWIGAVIGVFQSIHMYVTLVSGYSGEAQASAASLGVGAISSALVGALAGALIAWAYRLYAFVDHH